MKKSLAQLKRDAKLGKFEGRMILWCSSTDIPQRLSGWRKLVDANTVSISFLNNQGKESELRLPCSNLVEYTSSGLILYRAGLRDLNEVEKAFFEKWEEEKKRTDFDSRSETDILTDGSSTYWQRKHYFIDNGFEYLLGHNEKQGKKFDFNTGKVRDNTIKGEKEMEYLIRKVVIV